MENVKQNEIHLAVRRIGLALHTSHNLTVTDMPDAIVDETHWKTNHSQELKDLEYLEKILISNGIYHGCNCCNKNLL